MIIWAFPGMGKSYAALNNSESIFDCDATRFKYDVNPDTNLHGFLLNDCSRKNQYPENYISYVNKFDNLYNYVLINCEPNIFSNFSDMRVVYPDVSLKAEYLQRYRDRGDNDTFISYMDECFEEMVNYFDSLSCKFKIKIKDSNKYLVDIMEESRMEFMSKTAVVAIISEAVKYGLFKKSNDMSIEKTADEIFEGNIVVDFDDLKSKIDACYKKEALEKKYADNRNGLSHEELTELIMDSMVSGVAEIYYGEIAPYSHGYRYRFNDKDYQMYDCSEFFDCAEKVCSAIGKGKYCIDIDNLKICTLTALENEKNITSYEYSDRLDWHLGDQYYHHIHRLRDVHEHKGLDAIIQGRCSGTWSNCMACKENNLIRQMVAFKGFCVDYAMNNNGEVFNANFKKALVDYHKRHGVDISDINNWIDNNYNKSFQSATAKVAVKSR